MSRGLLLDQNLSRNLIPSLEPVFPGSLHVSAIGLAAASDLAVWAYARKSSMAIVSKDADFHHLGFLEKSPPKTIWVRMGDCRTAQIASCLLGNAEAIHMFLADSVHTILTLDGGSVSWPPAFAKDTGR